MGRKNKSVNRPVAPDSKYNSPVISKFVCRMMIDGDIYVILGLE